MRIRLLALSHIKDGADRTQAAKYKNLDRKRPSFKIINKPLTTK